MWLVVLVFAVLFLIGLPLYISGGNGVEKVESKYGKDAINNYYKEVKNNPQSLSDENKQIQIEIIKAVKNSTLKKLIGIMLSAFPTGIGLGVGLYYLLGTVAIIIGVILAIALIVLRVKDHKFIQKNLFVTTFMLCFAIGTVFVSIISCSDGSGNDDDYDYEDSPQYYEDVHEYYQDKDNWNRDFGDKYGYRIGE